MQYTSSQLKSEQSKPKSNQTKPTTRQRQFRPNQVTPTRINAKHFKQKQTSININSSINQCRTNIKATKTNAFNSNQNQRQIKSNQSNLKSNRIITNQMNPTQKQHQHQHQHKYIPKSKRIKSTPYQNNSNHKSTSNQIK